MATPTITPGMIKTGPGMIRYAPLGTAIPTVTAAASKVSATWDAAWITVGATEGGTTYSENTDTEEIRVAESVYPVRVVTTGKSGSVSLALAQISDKNWKLAANGGTITASGTGVTALSTYIPPLVGQEIRVMLAFQSTEDDEIIVWPQVFNTGSLEIVRGDLATMATIPLEFSVELPDAAVLTTPYKRWVTGSLIQA
jgi:hypothetical protein